MTQDMMTGCASFVREELRCRAASARMIGFYGRRLMALEVEGLAGAAHGERLRITHR